MKRFLAVLLSSVMIATSMPFAPNAFAMEGEDLSPSDSIVKDKVRVVDSRTVPIEQDRKVVNDALKSGYLLVPEDPSAPLQALSASDVGEDPNASKKSELIDVEPYKGKEHFAFCQPKGSSRPAYTSYKRLKGSKDTNDIIYCLNKDRDNPPDNSSMSQIGQASDELLYIIRLGHPRKHKSVSKHFTGDRFQDYYITQLAVWIAVKDVTQSAVASGKAVNGAPGDLPAKGARLYVDCQKYGPGVVAPSLTIDNKRREAIEDKDPSQLSTPDGGIRLRSDSMGIVGNLGDGSTKSFVMRLTNPPPGTRVLVKDAVTGRNRTYEWGKQTPHIYIWEYFRFVFPNPGKSGEFKYTITGNYSTWKAYRYESNLGGSYQNMLKENIVEGSKTVETNGEVFWNVTPPPPPPPTEEPNVKIEKVDADTGSAVSGATIGIFTSGGRKVHQFVSSNRPVDISNYVTVGDSYYAQELQAPPGYILDNSKHNFVPRDKSLVKVEIENSKELTPQPDEYTINVIKEDSKNASKLAGAEFNIKGSKTDKTFKTGSSGIVTFTNLKAGTYTITEVTPPPGYTLPAQASQQVTVGPNTPNKTLTVTFKDEKELPKTFKLTGLKVDATNDNPLAGAEFKLTMPDGKTQTGTSGSNGIVEFSNLTQTGKYVLEETKAPTGYQLADNPKQDINVPDASNPPVTKFTFKNQPIPEEKRFELKAVKVDATNNNPLAGAEFTLTLPDKTIKTGTSNTKGEVVFSGLTQKGEYVIEETKAPTGYQLADNPKQNVNVTDIDNIPVTVFTFKNKPIPVEKKFQLQVKKLDAENNKELAGAEFTLTTPSGKKLVETTGVDGVAVFNGLSELGKYIIEETKAPDGYELSENPRKEVNVTDADKAPTAFIEFKNKPIVNSFGLKIMKEDGVTHKGLAGAMFSLTKPDGSKVVGVSSADGTLEFKGLTETGKYIIEETKAPAGYQLAENPRQEVNVTDAKNPPTTVFRFENMPIIGKVKLTKVDSETNQTLKGVKFGLYVDGTDKEVGQYVTDANGVIEVDRLNPGKYYFKELKGLDGYITDQSKLPFEIPSAGGVITLTKKNTPKTPDTGEVQITKTDVASGEVIPGAKIKIYAADKTTVLAEGVTGADGVFKFGPLEPGTYYFQESGAPAGYILDSTLHEFTVKPGGDIVKCTLTNKPVTGEVQITKTDVSTGEVIPGATISIYDSNKKVITSGKTGADGIFKFGPLKPGTYYYQESGAPAGYELDDTLYAFEIKPDGGITKCTLTNKPVTGKVVITKKDVVDGDVIPGATITIYDSNKKVITSGKTDSNGIFEFGPLKPGSYYFQETGAPAGYVLDDKLYPFEIKPDGGVTKCTLTNKPIEGTLEISKVDISTGKLIPNAKFVIYDENKNSVVKGVTDENGIAKFKLKAGKYFYQEYDAPVGYKLDDTLFPFEIKENNEIIKCRMTNVPMPEAPLVKTGATALLSGGGISALISAIALFFGKKH